MHSFRLFNSNLRYKTVMYFSLGLAGMIISFLFISRYFFLYSLNELENMEIKRASHQAQSVIQMMVHQQEERSYDWAAWDETYYLLKDHDVAAYRARNLYIETLDTLSVDLMAFATLNGEVLDYISREDILGSSTARLSSLMNNQHIANHIEEMNAGADHLRKSLSGLFKVNDDVWVVSLTPVRNSEETLPSSGWLLWGKNLTSRFPGDFQSILTTNNALVFNLPGKTSSLLAASRNNALILREAEQITLLTTIHGIDNGTIAYLKTDIPREHYNKGNSLFSYLFAAVGLSTSLVAGLTFFMFRKGVTTRFNTFEQGINRLASKYQLTAPSKGQNDELDRATQLVELLSNNALIAEDIAQDTLQKYSALYDSRSIGVFIILDGLIMDVNHNALELLGYSKEGLIEHPLSKLCAGDDPKCHVDQMYQQLNQGQLNFEATLLASNGEEIECHLEAAVIQQNGQSALMLLIHDLREQKEQLKLIRELEGRDPVSGLNNRPAILNRLRDLTDTKPNKFSFMYISIGALKQVSEVYGHLIFDDAIRHISSVFMQQLPHYEIGRISEYEYIAIVPENSDVTSALRSANKLIDNFSIKTEISGLSIDLNCKVVLVDSKLTHNSLEYLLQAAYYSSQTELDSQCDEVLLMGEQLSQQAQISLVISRELNSAIDSGQIGAYYQPIVDTQTGEINGFEALARWFHPSLGIVSPNVFIPLAEQNQLIVKLDESILYQACEFISQLNQRRAKEAMKTLSIHVNLSAKHFYHAQLTEHLKEVMAKFNIGAGQLVLELTESMLMGVETETIHRMNEIKKLGVQLALDDFGTGYASFGTLCAFPLDVVKLDKSYIDQVETNDRAKTLLRSIANMAHELGLATVAEGVETSSQVRKLKVWNIDEIQGYYFHKPMSKEDALKQFSALNS
ncbi:EAL domain-containing protein [Vibrio sp. 404]|uniref:EAL domain-containing protein n=1 Tax=Vibrio marinisediminis TaxID=2758441 RepID=A0A7W2FTA0_9VIBR|nr:EAL domain-containing protein [Vibrio marinisediminis]MBA5763827.1 EAL domain-containing protein [Vibrio marinisediminis]